jgi:hypothetical protein
MMQVATFMTSNNDRPRAGNMPEFSFTPSPLIPPVDVARPENGDRDLDYWATERIAIYASLDAAMTRHIVEAISALSELKQRAEEEALATTQALMKDRDVLKAQVEELREEHIRLETIINDARRAQEEEQARVMILQQSSAVWIEEAQTEREESQIELRRLRAQIEEAQKELNEIYTRRSEIIAGSGGFAAWLERQSRMGEFVPVLSPAPPEPRIPGNNDDFGDTPTPKVPGGSPVIRVAPPVPVPMHENRDEKMETLLANSDPDTSDSLRNFDIFEQIGDIAVPGDEPSPEIGRLPSPDSIEASLASIFNAGATTRDRKTRARTDERISQIVERSRTVEDDEAPPIVDLPQNTIEFLKLLGAQLGLDAATPPPTADFKFAPGFTPPPGVSRKPLRELLGDFSATSNEQRAASDEPVTSREPIPTSSRAAHDEQVTPKAPREIPLPVVPESNGSNGNGGKSSASQRGSIVNRQSSIVNRSDDDFDLAEFEAADELGSRTLEELLEAGEREAATFREDPTPPDELSPLIGELGDNAARFESSLPPTPPSYDWQDSSLRPVSIPPEPSTSPPAFPVASGSNPARRPTGGLVFPGFPLKPPATPGGSAIDASRTRQTIVTIANLQGRYSPLMMEKIIRGLPDVAQVIVTDFSKGVLVMDVRHIADFDLAGTLMAMPELRLRLVEQTDGGLEFSQDHDE